MSGAAKSAPSRRRPRERLLRRHQSGRLEMVAVAVQQLEAAAHPDRL